MQDEQSQTDTPPTPTGPQSACPSDTSPNHQITRSPNPSRDMFGGPWLGVVAFIVVAIGLGWGLAAIFGQMLDQTSQTLSMQELDHGFDPDQTFVLKHDMLLGYQANGTPVLVPGRNDLPRYAPGRKQFPTIAQYQASTDPKADYPDLRGVVERKTRVRFVDVTDDRNNAQTRVLVRVELLTGPYAAKTPVLGLHLESADTDEETGAKRYVPHPDLFEPVEP